jgi:hypothetical protein
MKHEKFINSDLCLCVSWKTVVPHSVHCTRNLLTSESMYTFTFYYKYSSAPKISLFSLYVIYYVFIVYNGWTSDICLPPGVLNKAQLLKLGQFKWWGTHSRTQLSLIGNANVNNCTSSIFRNVMFFSKYQTMENSRNPRNIFSLPLLWIIFVNKIIVYSVYEHQEKRSL